MARKPNKNGTERIYIRLSAQNARHLMELADLGIHGVTRSEVAKHFVANEIERMVRDKFLKLRRASGKRT